MKAKNFKMLIGIVLMMNASLTLAQSEISSRLKPISLDPDYNHIRWGIAPTDLKFDFAAYSVSFDSDDQNDGNGNDLWAIPEWVAFEIKENPNDIAAYNRPSKWITHDSLHEISVVPADGTYHISKPSNLKIVKSDYRFVRGHMCPKKTADRISMEAGYNTHTLLNAVPQLQWQNNGVWKKIEKNCNDWADAYGQVWVVCGPVFFNNSPSLWLGEDGEVKTAIPDALYKIVIRETDEGVATLAFIIPNVVPKENKDPKEFITSITNVEAVTGLQFLSNVTDEDLGDIKTETGDYNAWLKDIDD